MLKGRGDYGYTDMMMGGRMPKDDERSDAVGELDSLHASLGLIHHFLDSSDREHMITIQKSLINLMGEIPCKEENKVKYLVKFGGLKHEDLDYLYSWVESLADKLDEELGGQNTWSLYGQRGFNSALLFKASTDIRRCERRVVKLKHMGYLIRDEILSFINRLDKLVYMLAKKYEDEN